MSDPFEVMGVARGADEATIRKRYLELVRESPPDRAPERFAAVRAAYDEVRDPARRIAAQLFEITTSDSLEAIVEDLRSRIRSARYRLDDLFKLAELP